VASSGLSQSHQIRTRRWQLYDGVDACIAWLAWSGRAEGMKLLTLLTSELRAVADAEGARRTGGWVVIKSAAEGR
jgi:hypothetical protein